MQCRAMGVKLCQHRCNLARSPYRLHIDLRFQQHFSLTHPEFVHSHIRALQVHSGLEIGFKPLIKSSSTTLRFAPKIYLCKTFKSTHICYQIEGLPWHLQVSRVGKEVVVELRRLAQGIVTAASALLGVQRVQGPRVKGGGRAGKQRRPPQLVRRRGLV